MNYSSRIDRVFAHGANANSNYSIPGTNDPIINSESGGFESDFETNGTTLSTNDELGKRQIDGNPYTCERLSPLPKRCEAMQEAVFKCVSFCSARLSCSKGRTITDSSSACGLPSPRGAQPLSPRSSVRSGLWTAITMWMLPETKRTLSLHGRHLLDSCCYHRQAIGRCWKIQSSSILQCSTSWTWGLMGSCLTMALDDPAWPYLN